MRGLAVVSHACGAVTRELDFNYLLTIHFIDAFKPLKSNSLIKNKGRDEAIMDDHKNNKNMPKLVPLVGAPAENKENKSSNGFTVVAHALANAGVRNIYGVIGIPVTELASAAQASKI